MSYKEPYKGVPLRACAKCGKMARTWNYCPACTQKINEEYQRKLREEAETRKKAG